MGNPVVQLENIKVADPSVAFTLTFVLSPNPKPKALRVSVKLTDKQNDQVVVVHRSVVEIEDPTDGAMNFIVPFGDTNKPRPGKTYGYDIKVNDGRIKVKDGSGEAKAGSGRFIPVELTNRVEICFGFPVKMDQVLHAGSGIVSLEGTHIGLMQYDGCFAVYEISNTITGPRLPLSTPIKPIAPGTPFLYVAEDGHVYTAGFDANLNRLLTIAKSTTPVVGATFVISGGNFCMQLGDGMPTPIVFALA